MLVNIIQDFDVGSRRYYAGDNVEVDGQLGRRWIADGRAEEDTDGVIDARSVALSPEAFGSVSSGATAVSRALDTAYCIFRKGRTYDLGGQVVTCTKSVTIIWQDGATITNGWLQLRPAASDPLKRVTIIGNPILGANASLRIAGNYTASETDPLTPDPAAVTVQCGDITATSKFSGVVNVVAIFATKNSRIGNITVTGTGLLNGSGQPEVAARGMYLADMWDTELGNLSADGDYSMGVEFDHTTTRPAYSLTRCRVGNIYSHKATSFADQSGDHGVYFHGAYDTHIRSVRASGWGDTISSSADLKFRDNNGCSIGRVEVARMRFTSDNNYAPIPTLYNQNNTIGRLTASTSLTTETSASGLHINNRVGHVTAPVMSIDSNNSTARGFVFFGDHTLGAASTSPSFVLTPIEFEQSRITLLGTPALKGDIMTFRDTEFVSAPRFNPAANGSNLSTMIMRNCRVNGNLNYDPGNSSTSLSMVFLLDWKDVHVTGFVLANSTTAATQRQVTAYWREVSSDSNEPSSGASPSRHPRTKHYRDVHFADVSYDRLEA